MCVSDRNDRLYGTLVEKSRQRVVISFDEDVEDAVLLRAIKTYGEGDRFCWRIDKAVTVSFPFMYIHAYVYI